MSRTSVQLSKWMITLDGIQVPHSSWSVTTGVDHPGQAAIVIEPDDILNRLSPDTMVHIWMYDDLEESDDIQDKYKLYWEGMVRQISYSKLPSRAYTVLALGTFSTLERHRAFMAGVGNAGVWPLLTGSTLLIPPGDIGTTALTLSAIIGQSFSKDSQGGLSPSREIQFRNSREFVYGDRLLKLLVYFSSYNALFRLHVVRTRLLNKIAFLPDRTLEYMLPLNIGINMLRGLGQGNLSDESSILDMVMYYNSVLFNHYTSMTGPHFPKTQPDNYDLVSEVGKDPAQTVYSIVRKFYRNDFVFLPHTFYAIPPSCNLVFPEYVRSIGVTRDFLIEPTRAVVADNVHQTNLQVVAPDEILRYEKGPVTPDQFWAYGGPKKLEDDTTEQGVPEPSSPYITPGENGIDLFGAVTDAEIEKGIILTSVADPMYLFKALANNVLGDLSGGAEQAKGYVESLIDGNLTGMAGKISGGDDKTARDRSYIYIMKMIAEYGLNLARFRRAVSISLEGHRWLCPGFPTIIFDRTTSFMGWVKSHTFSVDENGGESSSVDLDFVRPFPYQDREKIAGISRQVQQSEKALGDSLSNMKTAYSKTKSVGLSGIQDALDGLKVPKEEWDRPYSSLSPQLKEARQGYMIIAAQFERVYRETVEKPTVAGKLYLQSIPNKDDRLQQIKEVHEYLVSNPSLTAQNYDDAEGWILSMGIVVSEFMSHQVDNIDKVAEQGGIQLDSVSTMGMGAIEMARVSYEKAAKEAAASVDPPDDYPYPPIFGNPDLVSLKKSEKIYADLLGAQPAFSAIGKDLLGGEAEFPAGPSDILTFQKRSFAKFAQFMDVVAKIFPVMFPRSEAGDLGAPRQDTDETGLSMWEDRSSKDDSVESVRKWEEKIFLRRTGLMSLREFLKKHDLMLDTYVSEAPTPTFFYVLLPSNPSRPTKSGAGKNLIWDNTIFSKIVDEFEDQPRNGKNRDATIRKLRESVKNPFLTTFERQSRLIKYARRHFGSRAFDGS